MQNESRPRLFKSGIPKCAYLATILVFCCTLVVSGQPAQPTPTPTNLDEVNEVHTLFSERAKVIDELTELEQTIEELAAKLRALPSREQLNREATRLSRELEKEEKAPARNEENISFIRGKIEENNEQLETAKNSTQLQQKKFDREQHRRRLSQIENRIASLFDATRDVNQFRSGATWAFTGLVLLVVGGFFVIAYRKDGIAAKIFAGEMGMQFVTLFLIVIAIILFGIMGTLEGRELAALLGGLSGYILGKTGIKRDEPSQPNPNPTPNPNPDPNQMQDENQNREP